MKAVLVVALLAAVAFAGCTDDNPNEPGSEPGSGGDGSEPGTNQTVEWFPVLTQETEVITEQFSGSIAHTDQATVCVNGCPFVLHSVSELMEPDTAYFLEASLSQANNAAQGRPVYYSLLGSAGIRDYSGPSYESSTQTIDMTATLQAQGEHDISFRVSSNVILDPAAASYTIDVTLTPVADAIPQYSAAAIQLDEGETLRIESPTGTGRVAIFDPDDVHMVTVDLTQPENGTGVTGNPGANVIENAVAGEYLVWTLDDIWAQAFVAGGDDNIPELRHISLSIVNDDVGSPPASGPVEFTFDLPPGAVQVGFRWGSFTGCASLESLADGCFISIGTAASLLDPDGEEIVGVDVYNCYLCGGGPSYASSYDELVPPAGTYTITYDSAQSNNVDVRGAYIVLDR